MQKSLQINWFSLPRWKGVRGKVKCAAATKSLVDARSLTGFIFHPTNVSLDQSSLFAATSRRIFGGSKPRSSEPSIATGASQFVPATGQAKPSLQQQPSFGGSWHIQDTLRWLSLRHLLNIRSVICFGEKSDRWFTRTHDYLSPGLGDLQGENPRPRTNVRPELTEDRRKHTTRCRSNLLKPP
jgi:hypothetical protein